MEKQDFGVKTIIKKRKYNKKTRERLRRRRQQLQEEFDKEGLNLIATFRDVINCPPRKVQRDNIERGPKIISNEAVVNKYKIEDLGDHIRVSQQTSPEVVVLKTVYKPPLICLVTPPRSDEEKNCKDLSRPVDKGIITLNTAPKRQGVHFNPGRRVQNPNVINSRPILMCATCTVKPKDNFCNSCFERNYFYVSHVPKFEKNPRNHVIRNREEIELRNRLRDLFGESDISD